ncbi:MAG: TraX protein [Blautia sp.]|nr:TraX protein [Blautia sp.]
MSTTNENPSFLPKQLHILSGSSLKVLACIIMFIDHYASCLLRYSPAANTFLYSFMGKNYSLYSFCRNVGRLAFPIFCFLLVEGFYHTSNRIRYGRNLLLFALLSEIPWNFASGRTLHYDKQNVYFTLLLGFLAMCLVELFQGFALMQAIALFGCLFLAIPLQADYSYRGYILIMIIYFLRQKRAAQALIASAWLKYEWTAGFAFLPINMYNGKRGFVKAPALKYFFYLFYPVHLAILAALRWNIYHI